MYTTVTDGNIAFKMFYNRKTSEVSKGIELDLMIEHFNEPVRTQLTVTILDLKTLTPRYGNGVYIFKYVSVVESHYT